MSLLSSQGHSIALVSGQAPSGSTSSSNSEVIRGVSGLGEGVSGGLASLLAKNSEDLGNVLAHSSDSSHLGLRGRGDLGDSEGGEFFLNRWIKHE